MNGQERQARLRSIGFHPLPGNLTEPEAALVLGGRVALDDLGSRLIRIAKPLHALVPVQLHGHPAPIHELKMHQTVAVALDGDFLTLQPLGHTQSVDKTGAIAGDTVVGKGDALVVPGPDRLVETKVIQAPP